MLTAANITTVPKSRRLFCTVVKLRHDMRSFRLDGDREFSIDDNHDMQHRPFVVRRLSHGRKDDGVRERGVPDPGIPP